MVKNCRRDRWGFPLSHKFVVIAEAPADIKIACDLGDRLLTQAEDWIDDQTLQSAREWITAVSDEHGVEPLLWKNVAKLARRKRIQKLGHFDGKPGHPDARQARIALILARRIVSDLAGVILVRDSDQQLSRGAGLQQAKDTSVGLSIAIGLAIPEREAWVLAGFEPQDDREKKVLSDERRRIGFDPRTHSHQLMATSDDRADKSPKRVLRSLSGGAPDREAMCWLETDLETLRLRGDQNGLKAFLDELKQLLIPPITGKSIG